MVLLVVKATFRDAEHIVGSAIAMLSLEENGRTSFLCFTGDPGRENIPIARDPFLVSGAYVLIIESTYGNRLHVPSSSMARKEVTMIRVIIERRVRKGADTAPLFRELSGQAGVSQSGSMSDETSFNTRHSLHIVVISSWQSLQDWKELEKSKRSPKIYGQIRSLLVK